MNNCKFRIITLILGVAIFLCACDKIPDLYAKIDIIGENIENIIENHEKKIFSDDAVRYKFNPDNLLKLKEIIIDKDVLAYVFAEGSELINIVKYDEDLKTWIKNAQTDTIKPVEQWEVIDNKSEYLWVIHYNTEEIDFKYGVMFSNCYYPEDDGYMINFGHINMKVFYIKNIETPVLTITDIRNVRYDQRYEDRNWSEIEKAFLGYDPNVADSHLY